MTARRLATRVGRAAAACGRWLGELTEEMACLVAAWLLVGGFLEMPAWRAGAYFAPAVILLWIFLPPRVEFVPPDSKRKG